MNYFTFVFGFICLVLAVNGGKNDEHAELREKCSAEVGLELGTRDGQSERAVLQNPKSKCYLKCFLDGLHVYKADYSFDSPAIVALVEESARERVVPLLMKCKDESSGIADKCEKSYTAIKCVFDEAPEVIEGCGMFGPP